MGPERNRNTMGPKQNSGCRSLSARNIAGWKNARIRRRSHSCTPGKAARKQRHGRTNERGGKEMKIPHLSDPASLRDSRAGKQPEGTGTTEKGKQPAAQEKRTCTTRQETQTQPALLTELQALHHKHIEATRLFLMAASQGVTDAQIAMLCGNGTLISLILPLFKTKALANSLRGSAYKKSKARKIMSRRSGHAPRVKLRRRNHCCSPLTTPLLQLWKPSPLRTGAGLGRLAGRSC